MQAKQSLSARGKTEGAIQARFGRVMSRRGWVAAVAESCTGGGLGALITSVPGSSGWFAGGVIAYANDVKRRLLGVPGRVLAAHGAVSEQTARRMAEGARSLFGADLGISITGIAGPGGGSARKPAGLVFIGLAAAGKCTVRRIRFSGGRASVRRQAVETAIRMAIKIAGG